MEENSRPNKEELLKMMDEMIDSFDKLPPHAQFAPCSQCDLNASLILIRQLFRVKE